LKSYGVGDLRPLLPDETVLEILTYDQVRCGFCALHLPTEAQHMAILATLFNRFFTMPVRVSLTLITASPTVEET
jgi:hypothetical protein